MDGFEMAYFIGSVLGSALIVWIFTYLIFKYGTKNIKINFALQVAAGLALTYLGASVYEEFNDQIIAKCVGLMLALGIMLVIMNKKKVIELTKGA
jgi:hypothetical protein